MSLFLLEIAPSSATREGSQVVLDALLGAGGGEAAEVIESQVAADHSRLFTVVEAGSAEAAAAVGEAVREVAEEVQGPDEVRLVGAELEEIKALRRGAGYLVEWDIPAEIKIGRASCRERV